MSAYPNSIAAELDQLEDNLDSAHAMLAYIEGLHEDAYPFGVVERLMDGENAVRVYRELRELAVAELAERAGLSAQALAEIETGDAEPGIRVMARLAEALGIDIDSLVPWPDRRGGASGHASGHASGLLDA